MALEIPLHESLERAFRLAYFIHGERTTALRVAAEATARMELAASAQRKRLHYSPMGRARGGDAAAPHRTKVVMDGRQLLQRLVYVVSEPFEREGEKGAGANVSEEDMIIRFVKHLVRVTVKRNSFYVALGLGRLLHDYPTPEVMDLHATVVGDPDRLRGDDYCRSRKRKLMRELRERFAGLLETVRGSRGEVRFRARTDGRGRGLVRRCLELFTPWDTRCVVPGTFDPHRDEIDELRFDGDDPDGEHPIELDRMHALLHPHCLERLARALGLDAPVERLQVPLFALASGGSPGSGERRPPRPLGEGELAAVAGELAERAGRRRRYAPAQLSIRVDGGERARLDPARQRSVAFDLTEDDELVEVWAPSDGGDLLLATHLLDWPEEARPGSEELFSIRLEGGQELSFAASAGPATETVRLEVGYRETSPVARLSLAGRRWARSLGEALPDGRAFRPQRALAFGLAAVLAAGATVSLLWRVEPGGRLGDPARLYPPEALVSTPAPGSTRSSAEALPSPTAAELRTVYVADLGDAPWERELRVRLAAEVAAAGRLSVVAEPGRAEAALRRLELEGDLLALVTAAGDVLWSVPMPAAGRPAGESARELAADLGDHLHSP